MSRFDLGEFGKALTATEGDYAIRKNGDGSFTLIPGGAGTPGEVGPAGPRGPAGTNGRDGNDGAQGIPGDRGPTGPQGDRGAQGDRGDTGDTGPQGPDGARGPAGAASTVPGPQGVPGPRGNTGPRGDRGEQGERGEAGTNGSNGTFVRANPTVSDADPVINSITIEDIEYRIEGRGGEGDDIRSALEQAKAIITDGVANISARNSTGGLLDNEILTLEDGTTLNHIVDQRIDDGRPRVLLREYFQGDFITALITNDDTITGVALIHTVDRPDTGTPFSIGEDWFFGFLTAIRLELSENGLLTRTSGTDTDASLSENGLLTVASGYTLSENGLLMETA